MFQLEVIICQVVAYNRLETRETNKQTNKCSSLKATVVAYESWSPTRGLSFRDLVFWKTGCLREVITYGKGRFDYINTEAVMGFE